MVWAERSIDLQDDDTEELAALESKVTLLTNEIDNEIRQREDTEERCISLARLAQNCTALSELEFEMAQYGLADPAVLERKRRAVVLAREAACRWTDNYSVLFSHITRTLGCEAGELREYLGIGEGYEDIE
ncbi:meiotic nuclear division-like protein [Rhizoctonia solani]|uniref:Meiotic nuclear division-like protein n=1 Tax=Rhizoctonia solani TaxID=456999 RepID=A0A8H8T103_9AGAM|nr:meiotic nuclear division-like protein [Rhizoctonia solani]QRW24252.1 meiotic nuclear division-like protein [Rhizoctonia solani]